MSGTPVVALFPEVAAIAAELVRHPEVARRWSEESACAGMSVGGLAHHLAGQAGSAVHLLTTPSHPADVIPAVEHYRRAAWVAQGPDDEANVEIRVGADQHAAEGPEVLHAKVAADLAALPAAIEPVLRGWRAPDAVRLPWQEWSLTSSDFLLTRTMEVLVHSDDLAASIDVEPPTFPAPAAAAVLALLAEVAADRHGQSAVLRALSRPQRATGPVSAF